MERGTEWPEGVLAREANEVRLRRFGVWSAAPLAVGCAVMLDASAARAVVPHASMTTLTSSNGLGGLVYDASQYKITRFLEHPYQAASATTTTRNFAYDSYPGVRVGGTGTWLDTVKPTVIEYLPATGIIHTQRTLSGLTIDEYDFEPMTLAMNAAVMLVKVTQTGTSGPVDLYSLFNYQVGTGNPPSSAGESTSYDAAYDAYYEWGGASATMAFASLVPSTFHGSDSAAGPDNPYGLLNSGSNLKNDPSVSNVTGAVAGFQSSMGTLATGAVAWAGWVAALAPDPNNAQAAVVTARTWVNGRTLDKVLGDEQAYWAAWVKPAPAGASAAEAALDQQSQVLLKMAQVTEPAPANGQILASLPNTPPPASATSGNWNITWVRDMAYSTVALVRSGHFAEAKAALAFQMNATVGSYQADLAGPGGGAGVPYQISVCRYYGNGAEWSDSNSDGPNVEFDGFGLFLWALDEYVKASGDTAFLTTWWPTVKPKVADVLVHLQEASGLISPDSSIWEVHWNGQQRHFAYTTAAAANGLCSASRLATTAGDSTSSATYLTHGQAARDALIGHLRGPGGALGQSPEAIAAGTAWLDASVVEAINWGLIDPSNATAQATMSAMRAHLVVSDGQGFMRDQTGGWYDSQEWVFVDLRSARAFALGGSSTFSTSLFAWSTGQGSDNFNETSELYDPATGNYEGSPPMVGFGAGAYVIGLTDRGVPLTPSCGAFAAETTALADAGAAIDAGANDGGGPRGDGGGDAGVTPREGGLDARADGTLPVDAGRDGGVDAGHGDASRSPSSEGGYVEAFDAGTRSDAGAAQTGSSGGCSLSASRDDRGGWSFGLPLLGLGLLARRRRS